MNILYLKTDLHPQPFLAGGNVTHTVGVIKGFLDLGYSVCIATSSIMPALEQFSPNSPFLHLKIPRICRNLPWTINYLISSLLFLPKTYAFLKKTKSTHIYQRYSSCNLTGVFLSWITKVPLILEFNGSEAWANKHWSGKKARLFCIKLIAFLEKIIIRHSTKIVVISEVLANQIEQMGISRKKIIVAPNGVDPDEFDSVRLLPARTEIRDTYNCNEKLVVGFIGTFGAWHGIDVLLHIIQRASECTTPIHFFMIGDGQKLSWLKKELASKNISSHVTFTGLLPGIEARKYLAACDIFVCPTQPNSDGTEFFGSPTKLFEYLSLGKPVIASNLGQVAHIVAPAFTLDCKNVNFIPKNELGFCINPLDHEAFFQAICIVAAMPERYRALMGKNARAKALDQYTWVQHVQKIADACNF